MLLSKDANVNAQGREYGNALQAASAGGNKQVVEMLLSKGADVNAQGGLYGNALHAAAYRGNTETLNRLIASRSSLQLRDHYGRTLLWWAAAGGKTATVETLMNKHSFDPYTADNFGRKPSWIAAKKGHSAVLKLFRTYNEEPNTEPIAWENDQLYLECDICTSKILEAAFHYHCNLCSGGGWDICEDCRMCGATCLEMAHVLVKRTMLDGVWSEVTS